VVRFTNNAQFSGSRLVNLLRFPYVKDAKYWNRLLKRQSHRLPPVIRVALLFFRGSRKRKNVAIAVTNAEFHLAVVHRLQRPNDLGLGPYLLEEVPQATHVEAQCAGKLRLVAKVRAVERRMLVAPPANMQFSPPSSLAARQQS
jgi:hypothetical protein